MKNLLVKRILIFLFILLFLGGLFYFGYIQLTKEPKLYFIIENMDILEKPSDTIIHNYDEYKKLVDKYNVDIFLTPDNFKNNYYVASFQEYDSCKEKERMVEKVEINDDIKITYKINNKCGWCKEKVLLYLVKIEKVTSDLPVTYDYIYKNKLECEL